MAPVEPASTETFTQRYESLLPVASSERASEIQALEQQIFSRTPPVKQLIPTAPEHAQAVLGEGFVQSCSNCFAVNIASAPEPDETLFDELAGAEDGAVRRLAQVYRDDMHAYLEDKKNKPVATLSKQAAGTLQTKLNTELQKLNQQEKELKKELLQQVDHIEATASTHALARLVGKENKPNFDLLINLWLSGEIDKPWNQTALKELGLPEMDAGQLAKLDHEITLYVQIVTKRAALNRALTATEAYSASDNDPQLAQEAYELLNTKRYYSLDPQLSPDYRDLLLMEYGPPPIVLRETQTKIVREMAADPNAIRQAGMGEGKSKVAAPPPRQTQSRRHQPCHAHAS